MLNGINKLTNAEDNKTSKNNKVNKNKGFSLIEMLIVVIISGTILASAVSAYTHYIDTHNRQERVLLVQKSLRESTNSLKEALNTLPGQGLGTTNGQVFSIPSLPIAGSVQDQTGKLVPIRLGVVTPYIINGSPAITLVYSDPTVPRFPISENIKVDLFTGKIRIASPISVPVKLPLPPPNGGINSNLGLTNNSSSISSANQPNQTNTIIPPHTPTPTPTPSPVATPSPTPIPPNVPFDSTILGQNWIPNTSMFHIGDTLLLINEPAYSATDPTTTQTTSRLIKITGIASYAPPALINKTAYVELTFDLCSQGDCGQQFPGLTNSPSAPKVGAIVAPLKLSTFYLKPTNFGSVLMRNDGGVVLPTGNGSFQVNGGIETPVGETDSFIVNYRLADGTLQPTPNTPLVSWLNQITSVDITLSRTVPAAKGTEKISHTVNVSFPLAVKALQ